MKRNWQFVKDPIVKNGGRFILGSLEDAKGEVIISLTRGAGLNIPRLIVFMILTQFAKRQLAKNPDVIYAQLDGEIGAGQTITVWKAGKDMVSFRDSSWHRFVMDKFRWVLYSGNAESYFITYKSTKVPTAAEAQRILEEYGNHAVGGKQVRKATRYVG